MRSKLADRRLVVDHEDRSGARVHATAVSPRGACAVATGKVMVNTAPGRSVRLAASIVPQGLDEAAGDREPQARCRRAPASPFGPVELLEDVLQVGGMPSPSSAPEHDGVVVAPALERDGRAGGAYLAALSSRLNSTCSNRTASRSSIGRSAARSTSTGARASTGRRAAARADDLADRSPAGVRHDRARLERVMSSRLAMNRLSRSASSWMVPQVELVARRGAVEIAQRAGRASDRRERGLEVVRDRGEQGGAQPLGLRRALARRRPRPRRRARSRRRPGRAGRRAGGAGSGVSSGPGLSLSMPTTPIAPRPVRMGRNRRWRRAACPSRVRRAVVSPAHLAAARSAASSWSSGG